MYSAASNPSFYMVPTTNLSWSMILLWIAGYMFVFIASTYIAMYVCVTRFVKTFLIGTLAVLLLSITILDF